MAFASDMTRSAPANRGRFADLAGRIARYRLYRQTLNELAALNNSDLADLGICRAQIRALAYEAAYRGKT